MEKKTSSWQIIAVLGLFSLLSGLSGSSTNLALPKISLDLGISNSASTWIVQVGLITTAIFLVMFGHIGDLVSKNLVFLMGGLAFIVGSGITGIAPTYPIILFGRIVQAIGSAMILANSMGIVSQYVPNTSRAEALSIISMFVSVGSISGPAVGGIVITEVSWRWIFLFNVPVGLLILLFGWHTLPLPKRQPGELKQIMQQANWTGQNLFTIGIILFFLSGYFIQQGTSQLPLGLVILLVGTAITVFSFIQDDRSKQPWIDRSVLRNRRYMISVGILMLAMLVNSISNILLPFYLQSYGKMSAFDSGLLMMLQSVTMLFVSPISGYLADHWNRTILTIGGLIILVVSQVGYALYPPTMNLFQIIWPIVLNGIGIGFFLSPNNAIIMDSVPQSLGGVAGSLSSFARTLGLTIGISVGSSLLFLQLPDVKQITPQLGSRFMNAFSNLFWVATAISVLSLIIVVWRYYDGKKHPAPAAAAAPVSKPANK